jgi:enamine deaminase RidA (YjgF/YER057c/UK114 family)
MQVSFVNPQTVHKPTGYTHVVSIEGPGKLLYVSGQVARNQKGETVGVGDLEAQTRQVFENLSAILRTMGATLGDVAKMNVYLTKLDQIDKFRKVRDEYMPKDRLPATTLVGVTGLAMHEFLIEIEAIAVIK